MIRQTIATLFIMTLICGIIYPLACTGIIQLVFPQQANGSLIVDQRGNVMGSYLIGQPFSDPKYFWGRPSDTAVVPYNGAQSKGNNMGVNSVLLIKEVHKRVLKLKEADPQNNKPIPVDLVTPSASGLDPHISQAAAEYQIPRVARLRGKDNKEIRAMVKECSEGRTFDVLGEKRVNVLKLNLMLDGKLRDYGRNR